MMERKVVSRLVYLDGHATTALAPEAEAAMVPYWSVSAGNAQSPHVRGQRAAAAVEAARCDVAQLVGAEPQEIVFTSGATEANNLILLGVADAARKAGSGRTKLIASAIEHKSVLATLEELGRRGFEIELAPVTTGGVVALDALERLIDDKTLLVSVMGANNEVGVIQPLAAVSRLARAKGALVHSDIAQLAGKLPVDVVALDLDYASLSGHKLHGPMGVGAAFISGLAALKPRAQVFGGGQEGGLRAGTLPTPLVVGFGAAAKLLRQDLVEAGAQQERLAQKLLKGLSEQQVRVVQNAVSSERLPGSLSLQIIGADADEVVGRLSDVVCLSTGSACSSGQISTSHVLRAMSIPNDDALNIVRLYIDRYIDDSDIDFVVAHLSAAIRAVTGCRWVGDPVGSAHEVHSH